MFAFIIRRALQAIGVLLAVGIISFAMFRFAGDPVNQIVSLDTPAAEREQVRRSLGLDDPVPVQFARYLVQAAQGNFGISYQFRQPVSDLLAERMPATLELAICATLFATGFGVLMGVYSGLKRDSCPREALSDHLADRHLAPDLSDRHSADLSVLRHARLAPVLRPRRHRAPRLVDDRSSHRIGTQGADHALRSRSACSR